MHLDGGHVSGCGKLIILECVRELLAVFVVDELFEQAVRYSLHDATLHLRFHDLRIDDGAYVLGGHIPRELDLAGIGVDLNEGSVRAETNHRRISLEECGVLQSTTLSCWQIERCHDDPLHCFPECLPYIIAFTVDDMPIGKNKIVQIRVDFEIVRHHPRDLFL